MTMDEASDRWLVQRTRGGDIDAFGELVRRYQSSVYGVCYRLLGDSAEAEDLAQEAFLRAFRRLASYDADRPFGPWMRRVAANLTLNALQRRRPAPLEWEDEADQIGGDPEEMPEQAGERSALAERLRAGLLRLPEAYRAVIELRHYQDMSYEEMASALGIGVGDVRTRLFRARRMMARWLSDDG
ncbi:MAG TPA: sigma-70 family RNA polymerase sigma factor [Anaerolineales bacterium]|nr:sigma-70 family RNA polymerase sigma factor [Anaerolineales bacterium]